MTIKEVIARYGEEEKFMPELQIEWAEGLIADLRENGYSIIATEVRKLKAKEKKCPKGMVIGFNHLDATACLQTDIPLSLKKFNAVQKALMELKSTGFKPEHNQIIKLAGIKFQYKKVENGNVLP